MKHFTESYLLFIYINGLGDCGTEERRGLKVFQLKKINEVLFMFSSIIYGKINYSWFAAFKAPSRPAGCSKL